MKMGEDTAVVGVIWKKKTLKPHEVSYESYIFRCFPQIYLFDQPVVLVTVVNYS